MPDDKRGPIEDLLHEVWRDVARLDEGEIATYIPELAKADPSICGIGLATRDGHVYVAGELVPFTIQSVSKPFVYALALADRGADVVLQKSSNEVNALIRAVNRLLRKPAPKKKPAASQPPPKGEKRKSS